MGNLAVIALYSRLSFIYGPGPTFLVVAQNLSGKSGPSIYNQIVDGDGFPKQEIHNRVRSLFMESVAINIYTDSEDCISSTSAEV
jgi:hypothetical protein